MPHFVEVSYAQTGDSLNTNALGMCDMQAKAFIAFMKDASTTILLCTDATLRVAFEAVDESDFNHCLIAIDEFHHLSADAENRLGRVAL